MPNGLLIGHDQEVAAWAYATFRYFPVPVNRAYGIIGEDGVLKGAILFQNFNGTNVELSYYGPKTLSVSVIKTIARTVINEFHAARLTVVTSQRNRKLISRLNKMGFGIEGVQKRFYGHKDCRRNTGVRLVMFSEKFAKYAGIEPNAVCTTTGV